MKRNRITNVIIVVLVIAAVYQTGELWLEGTTGHNFFRAVKESISATDEAAESNALLATRYAVGDGASNFSVYYPDKVGSSDMLEKANDVLQEILAENIGESTELEKADWKEMLQNKCIVMQYDFMINMDDYLAGMRSLKNGQDLESFDYITIVPARRTGEESKAYFVNSQTNDCVVYRAMKSKSASILFEALQAQPKGKWSIFPQDRKPALPFSDGICSCPNGRSCPIIMIPCSKCLPLSRKAQSAVCCWKTRRNGFSVTSLWTGASGMKTGILYSVTALLCSVITRVTGCWSTITMKITAVTARKQPFWMAIRSAAIL